MNETTESKIDAGKSAFAKINELRKLLFAAQKLKQTLESDLDTTNSKASQLQDENAKLKAELGIIQEGAQKWADLEKEVYFLTEERKVSHQKIRSLLVELKNSKSKIAELEQNLAQEEKALRDLQTELESQEKIDYFHMKREKDELDSKIDQVKQEIDELTSEIKATEARIDELKDVETTLQEVFEALSSTIYTGKSGFYG
ncbi:MAG: hypothetical protein HQM10_25605 [Candidatus Riflebacteria bacterium]|nr:hypothetical protein [Candidatus Riflebacteria bacterium]